MDKIKKIAMVMVLLSIYSIGDRTTNITKEIKHEVGEVYDVVLDNEDNMKKLQKSINKINKKLKAKDKKVIGSTTINGKKVLYVKNAKNVFHNTIKNTNIVNKYYGKFSQCSEKCGIPIKKWSSAKKYCSIRGSRLPSKIQIENSDKYQKKECSDCSYWTSTEAKRPNGKSYPNTKVYVYSQSDDDFFKFATKYTYVATCLSEN